MPYSAALRATLFFRDVLSESTSFYPASGERPGVELTRKVNTFTNEVQLSIAEGYGVDRIGTGAPGDA